MPCVWLYRSLPQVSHAWLPRNSGKLNFVATVMPKRTEITKVTSDAKTWARIRSYSIDGSAPKPRVWYLLGYFDWISFVQKLSFTHTLASILVLIGTVQNPTRKGDPVIQRQPGLRGTRFEVAPSRLGMGYGRGESRAQIRI